MNFERARKLAVLLLKIARAIFILILVTISESKRFLDQGAVAQKVAYMVIGE